MKEKEVLHLMVNNTCLNDCPLCCNRQYDVGRIPVATVQELQEHDTICITGGEPFLVPKDLYQFLDHLFNQYLNIKTVYIYTSGGSLGDHLKSLVRLQDMGVSIGLSIGPKSTGDRNNLRFHDTQIRPHLKKLRAGNLYYGFTEPDRDLYLSHYSNAAEYIERRWQENFVPAPNTIFRRLSVWI